MKRMVQAAFRDVAGKVVGTGTFHDINSLPTEFQPQDEGFIDEGGSFWTREQVTHHMSYPAPIQSEELFRSEVELNKSMKDYSFEGPKIRVVDGQPTGHYEVNAFHGGKKIGTFSFASKPNQSDGPHNGYHRIGQADVHPLHRGNGIYGKLLTLASQFVKKSGSKGLVSVGEWRSELASKVWDKLAAQKKATSKPGKDPDAPDFFMSEKEDATSEVNVTHEFSVEFKRWLKAHQDGTPYQPPAIMTILKAESNLDSLLQYDNLQSGATEKMHEIARRMSGQTELSPEFEAAKFLAGGKDAPDDAVRLAMILYDNDMELAALRAYGFPRNEHYRELLRTAREMIKWVPSQHSRVAKSDFEPTAIPRVIEPATPDAKDVADAVVQAQTQGKIHEVNLDSKAKHSKGMAIAVCGDETWLLKPGSGQLSPALGVREEPASQSAREVAFYKVAEVIGIGDHFPRAELLIIDGHPVAAMKFLSEDYTGLDKYRREEKADISTELRPYLIDGSLFKWVTIDWVLGNSDRHANNLLINKRDKNVMLIDHGSAFAGPSFNPAHDSKSFTPAYLRAWAPDDKNWSELSPEDRESEMPHLTAQQAHEFGEWVDSVNPDQISEILTKYGINPQPTLSRLAKIQAVEPDKRSEYLLELWAGLAR